MTTDVLIEYCRDVLLNGSTAVFVPPTDEEELFTQKLAYGRTFDGGQSRQLVVAMLAMLFVSARTPLFNLMVNNFIGYLLRNHNKYVQICVMKVGVSRLKMQIVAAATPNFMKFIDGTMGLINGQEVETRLGRRVKRLSEPSANPAIDERLSRLSVDVVMFSKELGDWMTDA